MGGEPKGLLRAPGADETLVDRLVRAGTEAGLRPVLVGDASAYGAVAHGVSRIADDPAGVGPLGGLGALLAAAGEQDAIAVACDMPHVGAGVLSRIARHPSDAAILAPRRDGRWEPLLARYRPPLVRPALAATLSEGHRSFQALFARLPADALERDEEIDRALTDWDTPEQVGR